MGKIDELKASSNSPMMGRIERMVAEMCPEGVKWVKLGEVCRFQNGFAFKSNLFTKEGAPIVRITNINGVVVEDSDLKYFDPKDYKERLDNYEIHKNDILIAMSGATTGKIGISQLDYTLYLNQRVGKFVPDSRYLNNTYLYHILRSRSNELYIMAGGGAQPNLSSNKLMIEVTIPLPPLPIQEAIADILDKFDRLSAELQAELQARKQQYEYYRNQLLTRFAPDQPVTEYSLGDLGTFTRGTGLQKSDFVDEGFPCIHYGQIYTRFKTFTDKTLTFVDEELAKKLLHADNGDLVIATTSENVEDVCKSVAWLGEGQIATGGHACVYHHNQNPKYMAYFFQTDYFHNQKKKYAYGAKVIDIKIDNIAKITIPLPSLEEQARIVSILDKFEALVNDLSQGLPAEIAAVKEQYEYYRNKLLSFKPYD